jgi:hypothetical protein
MVWIPDDSPGRFQGRCGHQYTTVSDSGRARADSEGHQFPEERHFSSSTLPNAEEGACLTIRLLFAYNTVRAR